MFTDFYNLHILFFSEIRLNEALNINCIWNRETPSHSDKKYAFVTSENMRLKYENMLLKYENMLFQKYAFVTRNMLLSQEICFCHFSLCRALQFPPEAWLRISLHNGSITLLAIRPDGRVSIRQLGDCGHMPPASLSVTWWPCPLFRDLPTIGRCGCQIKVN